MSAPRKIRVATAQFRTGKDVDRVLQGGQVVDCAGDLLGFGDGCVEGVEGAVEVCGVGIESGQ